MHGRTYAWRPTGAKGEPGVVAQGGGREIKTIMGKVAVETLFHSKKAHVKEFSSISDTPRR